MSFHQSPHRGGKTKVLLPPIVGDAEKECAAVL